MTEKLEFLKNVYLFQDIPEKYIKNLVKEMSLINYVKGDEIIREGDQGESLFLLFKGRDAVTKKISEVRSATVIAEADCILGEIGAAKIHELIKAHPDFGLKFYRNLANVLADRLRKANRDTLKLATALSLALEE
ncbi:MAG: cyclic nucleotide-binding domain-containing protein [Calditrichota bacterium]